MNLNEKLKLFSYVKSIIIYRSKTGLQSAERTAETLLEELLARSGPSTPRCMCTKVTGGHFTANPALLKTKG